MASTTAVPEVPLRSGNARPMPAIGMGTAKFPVVPETTVKAVLEAVEVGYRVRDGAAPGRGPRGGGAPLARGILGGGVRHVQALVHAVPHAPRAAVPPGKPPEPADGVRGPVPHPLADQPEARASGVPGQEGRRHPVGPRGRVAGDGGVPPPRARQGHPLSWQLHASPYDTDRFLFLFIHSGGTEVDLRARSDPDRQELQQAEAPREP